MSGLGDSCLFDEVVPFEAGITAARKYVRFQGTTYVVHNTKVIIYAVTSGPSISCKSEKNTPLAKKLYAIAFPQTKKKHSYRHYLRDCQEINSKRSEAENIHEFKKKSRYRDESHRPKRRKPRQQRKVIW